MVQPASHNTFFSSSPRMRSSSEDGRDAFVMSNRRMAGGQLSRGRSSGVCPGISCQYNRSQREEVADSIKKMAMRSRIVQSAALDDIDRKILAVLQAEGRTSLAELSAKVGLSPSPCLRRI